MQFGALPSTGAGGCGPGQDANEVSCRQGRPALLTTSDASHGSPWAYVMRVYGPEGQTRSASPITYASAGQLAMFYHIQESSGNTDRGGEGGRVGGLGVGGGG